MCDGCCPTCLSDTISTQRMATRDVLTKRPAASFVREPRCIRLYRLFAISLASCAVVDDTAYSRGVNDHAEGADDQAIGLNIERQEEMSSHRCARTSRCVTGVPLARKHLSV